MKNKRKNKGHLDGNINIILFLGFIILIFLTCGCSYLFYNMFNAKNPSIVSSLVIHLSNSSKTIDEKDEAVDHKFKIYNKSNISATYKVVYYDNINEINTISRNDIHYELLLNNSVIKSGKVSDFTDNILVSKKIDSKETNNYSLRVWINEDVYAKDVHYTYHLKILPLED